jgi:hypothetical protein
MLASIWVNPQQGIWKDPRLRLSSQALLVGKPPQAIGEDVAELAALTSIVLDTQ